ncbi:hypothetical protein U729_3262 (plasmid) [Clostridium baratii str. Sullivan]|uniref:Uncharacterized protein n=1 Tax=Clostridium baratii str. Sullivan TaxID=1415775 RepID=A0A0A7G334_9CLOT|nr:hypothetical protein [Clostridium baratii]AIY85391.1 hypothetical protein U729_3262 [Clostridium baratii str. Sullivan]
MKKSTIKTNMFNFADGEIFAVPATKDFAKEFKTKFNDLDTTDLSNAKSVELFANELIDDKLVTFISLPVLVNGKPSLSQIVKSCKELVSLIDEMGWNSVRIPSFGYKFSSKNWSSIEKNIMNILDDRFEVYEYVIEENTSAKVYSVHEKENVSIKTNCKKLSDKFALIIDGTTYVDYALVESECNKAIEKYGKENVLIITREKYGACKHAIDFAEINDIKFMKLNSKPDNTSPVTRIAVTLAELAGKFKNRSVVVFTSENSPKPGSALLFYNIAKEYGLRPTRIKC